MAQQLNLDVLHEREVKKFLRWEELFASVESALSDFSKGKDGGIVQPLRSVTEVENHNGILLAMPSYSRDHDVLATKLLTIFERNSSKGLPVHTGLVILFDAQTGIPKAIMDAEPITAMRTAAASAIAAKHLCTDKPKMLAILGMGVQGKNHYQAFTRMFRFSQIRLWNRSHEKMVKYLDEIQETGQNVTVHVEASEAVQNADIVITTTNSAEPILKADWVKGGALIIIVGACRPNLREVDPILMKNSTVYVDSKQSALSESGDIILNYVRIEAEIGEIISGQKSPRKDTYVIFKSLGLGIEDAVSAKLVYTNFLRSKQESSEKAP